MVGELVWKDRMQAWEFSRALQSKLTQVCAYIGYLQAFSDTHMLMSTLGAKNEDLTMKLLDSLRKYVR